MPFPYLNNYDSIADAMELKNFISLSLLSYSTFSVSITVKLATTILEHHLASSADRLSGMPQLHDWKSPKSI